MRKRESWSMKKKERSLSSPKLARSGVPVETNYTTISSNFRTVGSASPIQESEGPTSAASAQQWTAVYPLPSLSNFTKRILNQGRSSERMNLLSEAYCTSSPVQAASIVSSISASNETYFGSGGCWLCSVNELPHWHFRHRHVAGGYRNCRNFDQAVLSIFYWHNESINMWSHILGTIFLIRKVYLVRQALLAIVNSSSANHTGSAYELNLFLGFLTLCMAAGNVVPIASSAFCHTFYGISPIWHRLCWFVDFVGLMFGVLGITMGYLAIAFMCPSTAHWFYAGALISVASFGYFIRRCYARFLPRMSVPVLTPNDRFPEFAANMAQFSAVNFALATMLTVCCCPQYFESPLLRSVLTSVAVFPVSLVLSLVIFAQGGVPERFSFWMGLPSGYFDFVGHSHQWWHVASCSILYFWLDVVVWHFEGRWQLGCENTL